MNFNRDMMLMTAMGGIGIRCLSSPEDLRSCTFDDQFTLDPQHDSLFAAHRLVEKFTQQPDAVVAAALTEHNRVIGYGVLAYLEQDERWADLGPQAMMEIKAIEVARDWRSCKIASAILKQIVCTPHSEEKILYMVGYSWTWDLIGTGNTAQQYRHILVRLFERHGFMEFQTNEPNVCLKAENLFMGRVGKNVSQVLLNRFKWLRFGLSPWRWQVRRDPA